MLMTKHVVLVLVNHRLTVFDQNNMRLFKSTKCSKYQPYVFNPYAFNPYVLNPTIKFQCCSRKFLILLFTCSAVFLSVKKNYLFLLRNILRLPIESVYPESVLVISPNFGTFSLFYFKMKYSLMFLGFENRVIFNKDSCQEKT